MSGLFHQATVLARQVLTPGMVRLTFGGQGMADLVSSGMGDEYLRLFFPDSASGRLYLPVMENGRWRYPDGKDKVCYSTYTVRHFRPERGELDIDFVVHAGGVASEWAQAVEPGQTITISRPRGLYAPPADTVWQLLVADATGIPAVSRILEQTGQHMQSRVFIEVADAEHEMDLPAHPNAVVTWLHYSGNGVAPSRLDTVVQSVPLPKTPGYIWAAGEQKVVRAIRKFVRGQLGLPVERYELVSYWIHNGEDWDARWERLPDDVKASIEAGWDSGRDREVVRDEYDATLEQFGL